MATLAKSAAVSQSALVFLLAVSAGVAVASIYYAQPILPLLGRSLSVSAAQTGFIPMVTQLGYAAGIFFLLPLGDKYNRRHLILIKGILLSAAMLCTGLSHSFMPVLAGSFIIGLAASLAQDIVPVAAIIAPVHQQGRYVGKAMTGLLLGILLSRTISGVFSDLAGWNALFVTTSVVILLITLALWRILPDFSSQRHLKYPALILSLKSLWQTYPVLRRAVLVQGLSAVGFSAVWSTLALGLSDSFGLGSTVAGLFGIAGAAGALAAPMAGSLADKYGASRVLTGAAGIMIISFALMFLLPYAGFTAQMVIIGLSVAGFDLGFQSCLIANQSQVYPLKPEARGRLNAVLFTGVFAGMAAGSVSGNYVYLHAGMSGVTALAVLCAAAAFFIQRR